jgi:hypothetical protein
MEINDKNPVSAAWILYINPEIAVAIGQYEIVYILKHEISVLKNINGPDFCNQSISWQEKIIKVFDLNRLINNCDKNIKEILYGYIIIVPYISDDHETLFLGLKIVNIPLNLHVKDTQQCNYPDNYDWDKLSSSCFYDEKYGIVPILDINKIYSYLG